MSELGRSRPARVASGLSGTALLKHVYLSLVASAYDLVSGCVPTAEIPVALPSSSGENLLQVSS